MSGSHPRNIVLLRHEQIQPRGDARPLNPDRVDQLADSISNVGLQSPIVVRPAASANAGTEDVYELVAGNHRYAALRKLKIREIPAFIADLDDLHAELTAIDENFCRETLTPAQETAAVVRRKQIYEALHPETKHGGSRTPSRQSGVLKSIRKSMKRFSAETALKTGRSERSIQRIAHRGENIDPADLSRIAGTSLDNGSELDALAELSASEQKRLVDLAASGTEVSARPASTTTPSMEWRKKFKHLIGAAPTEADREWAAEQLAILRTSRMPDIPPHLDRRTPKP
jgi:ParB family chromosome partitioning protein